MTSVIPKRLFTRERARAHTQSAYEGGRLKAIIIYPRMHREDDECQHSTNTLLAENCFEAWCAERLTLPKEAEGQVCGRILHSNRHKSLTLTLFLGSSVCFCYAVSGCASMYIPLHVNSLTPAALCSFTSTRICKLFLVLWKLAQALSWTRGFPQECVSRWLSHSFLCCQLK